MILITGGTGFLGKHVLSALDGKIPYHVISRKAADEFRGDLTKWNAGLNLEKLKKYKFQALVHLAGLYNFDASAVDCYLQNVAGTKTALHLAKTLNIPLFFNASTIASVINAPKATVTANEIFLDQVFPDPYAKTKALAEYMVRTWEGEPMGRINLRLGVLVGDTASGKIERIDGPYKGIEVFKNLRNFLSNMPVQVLPGVAGKHLPLVPVDAAAGGIVKLIEWGLKHQPKNFKSFFLTPKTGLAVEDYYHIVAKKLGIPHKHFQLTSHVPQSLVKKAASMVAGFPETDVHYLLNFKKYDSESTIEAIGEWCPEFADYEKTFWSGYEEFVQDR